jgi:hypothetical protein
VLIGCFSWGKWFEVVGKLRIGFWSVRTIDAHFDLAFFGPQHHRLLAQPPDHVERFLRLAAQRQFLDVGGDPLLDHLAQLRRNGEVPIRRTQAVQALVRAFVIVELHPQPHPLTGLLEAVKLRPRQELLPDRFPEPLDLPERHRMMRRALEVMDPILRQFPLEAGLAVPGRVLPPVVGEHLPGHPVLGHGAAVNLQHVLGGLAAEQIQSNHVAGMIIDETDQVRVLAAQSKREDVGLPHLVGRRTLEEPRLGRVLRRLLPAPLHQLVLMQGLSDRLVAAGQKQHPAQQVGDRFDPEGGMLLLQLDDLLFDRRANLSTSPQDIAGRRPKPGFAVLAIRPNPPRQRTVGNADFLGHQLEREPFFQPQPHGLQSNLGRESSALSGNFLPPRCPPRGAGLL